MKKLLAAALSCGFVLSALAGTDSSQPLQVGDSECKVLKSVEPVYPIEFQRRDTCGSALLCAGVSANGHVMGIKVLQSDNAVFAEAAVNALWQWQFEEAEDPTSDAIRRVQVPFLFEIDGTSGVALPSPLPRTVQYGSPECGAVKTVMPEYPIDMRRHCCSGKVTLCATLDPEGHVVGISIVDSDDPAFARAAIEALWNWQFEESANPDDARPRQVDIPFRFAMAGV